MPLDSDANHIRIIHFVDPRIPDSSSMKECGWKTFHKARNTVVETCKEFGTVGAMDICSFEEGDDWSLVEIKWKTTSVEDPDFFVIDDQMNQERYIYIEMNNAQIVGPRLLECLCSSLSSHRGWGLGVTNVAGGYIILFDGFIFLKGAIFANCKDVLATARVLSNALY